METRDLRKAVSWNWIMKKQSTNKPHFKTELVLFLKIPS